ncbi:MAG: cell division protein FtsH [Spirochaetae bacterium HGW-Spirochaetae-3]|nr:MAG: cell division protein FtsH [Spirochaetae bacterium HGW-Spirochaetae-3]
MPRKNDSWNPKNKKKTSKGNPIPPMNNWKYSIAYVFIAVVSISLFNWFVESADSSVVPYSEFKSLVASGRISRIELDSNYYTGYSSAPARQDGRTTEAGQTSVYKTVPINDPDFTKLLDEKKVVYSAVSREGNALLGFVLNWVLPIGLMFFLWRMLQKRLTGMGSNVLSVGQNKAVIVAEGDVKTRFVDVAGVDEAKEELVEVVDFLKNPKKYTDIGGKIPKGVLLVGPPGTGKTLLARAVAGEAGVPFFRMSGAEFVEMFVGVGAARVRDLFKQAREKAPCIVFIDELDAIGKSRVNGAMGGNDEREQTLNQLLVEMDGFDATSGLIILAATNRPDVLDPALLRPGRFDRQVGVDRPDIVGREAILNIHAKTVKLETATDLKKVARATPGFVGADLANVVNEAALLAVRAGRKKVQQQDFEKAVEKIMTGLEKKSRVMNPDERRVIAYHEAGHAIVAAFTPEADPVQKVSIVPRGFGALGFTLQVPIEDRYIVTQDKLLGEIDVLMGGRAAEDLTFGKISTGASNDITRATDIARRMITDYGMSERYRNVALTRRGAGMIGPSAEPVMAREYGEETQRYIDETVAETVSVRYDTAMKVLVARRDLLDKLAAELLEKESVDEAHFKAIIAGPDPATPAEEPAQA